jgi:CHAD domain-containing protein
VAYRIEPGEPTDVEIRGVLVDQLDRAARALRADGGPDAEAVHTVRKRLKKARSLLRLARGGDLGRAVARHANHELRAVGADLAPQRDADALVEVVDALIAAGPTEDRPVGDPGDRADADADALAEVRARLVDRAEAVRSAGAVDRRMAVGAARTLEQTATWLVRIPARTEGWEALAPGFTREYRRGREAFHALGEAPTVDDLHEWRKRVKDLWYHQRLLRRLWPEGQRPMVDAADELADALGDDHDLGLLLAHLVAVGDLRSPDLRLGTEAPEPLAVPPDVARRVRALARARRLQLQADARRAGALLYADTPEAWCDRHGAWWDAARDRAGRTGGPM